MNVLENWAVLLLTTLAATYRANAQIQNLWQGSAPVSYNTQTPPIYEFQGCGLRQDTGVTGRITIAQNPLFGEFPWTTGVFKFDTSLNRYQFHSGGSLIHPSVVLTVAHYYVAAGKYLAVAGDWDINKEYEIVAEQQREVQFIDWHSMYMKRQFSYDVALLFLASPINPAPNVGLACLPSAGMVTPAGTRCFVTGWGFESFAGNVQNIQRVAELPIVEKRACQTAIRNVIRSNLFSVHATMICAGGESNIDACFRDGGGPLVCPYADREGTYYQAGIVAAGVACGTTGVPSLYSDVAQLRTWIDQHMTLRGYNASTYTPN